MSPACYLMLAVWKTKSASCRRHLYSFPVGSNMFCTSRSTLRSVRITNCDPSRFRLNSRTAQTSANIPFCGVSYAVWYVCSTLFKPLASISQALLILQAATGIKNSLLSRDTDWCQLYNAQSVLVFPVPVVIEVHTMVFRAH